MFEPAFEMQKELNWGGEREHEQNWNSWGSLRLIQGHPEPLGPRIHEEEEETQGKPTTGVRSLISLHLSRVEA